jgi:nitroreductase
MIFELAIAALRAAVRERNPDPITVGVGGTGYLDRRFIPDKPASWGVDSYGRPFVTLCLRWRTRPGMVGHDERDEEPRELFAVNTIFQRYAEGSPNLWVAARNVGYDPFSPGEMKVSEIVQLIAVVRGIPIEDGPIDGLALAEPADVRRAFEWDDEADTRARGLKAHDVPGAAVHAERPQIIETTWRPKPRPDGHDLSSPNDDPSRPRGTLLGTCRRCGATGVSAHDKCPNAP